MENTKRKVTDDSFTDEGSHLAVMMKKNTCKSTNKEAFMTVGQGAHKGHTWGMHGAH